MRKAVAACQPKAATKATLQTPTPPAARRIPPAGPAARSLAPKPPAFPTKAVQRMIKDWSDSSEDDGDHDNYDYDDYDDHDDYSGDSGDSGEYSPNPEDVKQAQLEEEIYQKSELIKEKAKDYQRPSKPGGLVKKFFENNKNIRESTPDIDEKDVFANRQNKDKKAPANLGRAAVKYKIDCDRCHQVVRLTENYQESGVGFSRQNKRKRPPLGHRLDYSIYKHEMFLRSENVSEKYRNEYLKVATWDRRNLGIEHFDCNSKSDKVTDKNIDDDQVNQGIRYVENNHERWLNKAKKRIDK